MEKESIITPGLLIPWNYAIVLSHLRIVLRKTRTVKILNRKTTGSSLLRRRESVRNSPGFIRKKYWQILM
jgi:hypothetical protein